MIQRILLLLLIIQVMTHQQLLPQLQQPQLKLPLHQHQLLPQLPQLQPHHHLTVVIELSQAHLLEFLLKITELTSQQSMEPVPTEESSRLISKISWPQVQVEELQSMLQPQLWTQPPELATKISRTQQLERLLPIDLLTLSKISHTTMLQPRYVSTI